MLALPFLLALLAGLVLQAALLAALPTELLLARLLASLLGLLSLLTLLALLALWQELAGLGVTRLVLGLLALLLPQLL